MCALIYKSGMFHVERFSVATLWKTVLVFHVEHCSRKNSSGSSLPPVMFSPDSCGDKNGVTFHVEHLVEVFHVERCGKTGKNYD